MNRQRLKLYEYEYREASDCLAMYDNSLIGIDTCMAEIERLQAEARRLWERYEEHTRKIELLHDGKELPDETIPFETTTARPITLETSGHDERRSG